MERSHELMDALEYLVTTSEGEGEAVARAYRKLRDALVAPVAPSEPKNKENNGIEEATRLIRALVDEAEDLRSMLNDLRESGGWDALPVESVMWGADRFLESRGR